MGQISSWRASYNRLQVFNAKPVNPFGPLQGHHREEQRRAAQHLQVRRRVDSDVAVEQLLSKQRRQNVDSRRHRWSSERRQEQFDQQLEEKQSLQCGGDAR